MKTCPNCRCVYGDDYNGTCSDCGAPMGGTQANGSPDLSFRFARQTQASRREDATFRPEAVESRRGNVDAPIEQGIVDVAKSFISLEKLGQILGDSNA